jgi:hypothetical protein
MHVKEHSNQILDKKGILSIQTDQSNVQQRRLVELLSVVLQFVVLLAHSPATTPICAHQWLQGTAVVFKGWDAESLAFHA